ncbi:MAG TPA: iron uptake transporter deferrochelatase/peroxidase subunit [Solirubrobacterales bacterium]|jgi:deferrochelatase/peroxidase EfeB|nr:iron uptake transporter deferrochelatase/peroxidase subunit [Solirubrobacterales bacterium]
MTPITRRRLLASAGVGAAGVGLGAGGYLLGQDAAADPDGEGTGSVPFYGEHQAGIDTPAQDRLHFAAFDLISEDPAALRELMREWSRAAAEMSVGEMVGDVNKMPLAPPDDTGETVGLLPSSLTVTFGFGPGVFEKRGLGLAAKRPAALQPIPPLPADELNALESGGDVCVQACSDDPQVAFHAVRNLARIGRGTVVMRWSQLGFGRTSTTSRSQDTPRNLMGLKDGTANIRAEDTEAMRRHVWVGVDDGPAWMRGGSYMVTRRIRMLLEVWDRASLEDQEQTIGRHKYSGAPLGGRDEFEPLPLDAEVDGEPLIPVDAHVRLASARANGGERILRRGYSFTDGVDESLGELEAGLFFICFQRDPEKQFTAIQRRLGSSDALNEYIKHVGSAVFAVPPGAKPGGYVGETLLG